MKAIKQFIGGFLLCLAEVLVGVLLLIDPISFTDAIITFCGLAMVLWGLICIMQYFRAEPEKAAAGRGLMKGLVLLTAGIFAAVNAQWLVALFPLMTVIYGLVILLSAFGKIQWAVDMLRTKTGKWLFAAISAAVSLVCAAVILCAPFTSTAFLWAFTGVSLICEACLDVVTFLASGWKRREKKAKEVPGEAVEAAAAEEIKILEEVTQE